MEKGLGVFIGATTNNKIPTADVCRRIMQVKGVESVYELTGEFDVLIFARAESVHQINDVVEAVRMAKGVASTNTYLVLQKHPNDSAGE